MLSGRAYVKPGARGRLLKLQTGRGLVLLVLVLALALAVVDCCLVGWRFANFPPVFYLPYLSS